MKGTGASVLAALLILSLGPVGGMNRGHAQERAPDLAKIRVLLVIDTLSNLAESVRVDKGHMVSVFEKGIPANRFELTVLEGNDATPDQIIEYYRKVATGPNEALVFYYSGHGATFRDHTLVMGYNPQKGTPGRRLARQTLINAMRQKSPGLIVVLTDCCSDVHQAKKELTVGAPGPGAPPEDIHAVLRCLFFQHRGIVDITAATLDKSLGFNDDKIGGVFTFALTDLLSKDLKAFRAERGFLTWRVFFEPLKNETNEFVQMYAKAKRDRGETPQIEKQIPKAFQLADGGEVPRPRWRFGVQVFNNEGDGVYVKRVFPQTPADKAGISDGDVIVAIDGQVLKSEEDFAQAIDGSEGKIKVRVRSGQTREESTKEIRLDRLP